METKDRISANNSADCLVLCESVLSLVQALTVCAASAAAAAHLWPCTKLNSSVLARLTPYTE